MSRNARNGKKANLAKIRRRVGDYSNEMLKRRPVASIIGEKGEFDKNGKSGEKGEFGANICQSVGQNSVVKTRGTFRQVPTRRIRFSFVERAY